MLKFRVFLRGLLLVLSGLLLLFAAASLAATEAPVQSRPLPQSTPAAGQRIFLPLISRNYPNVEWTQLNGNPQRTGYVPTEVAWPWRVKWIWNGPAGGGDGGPAPGHLRLPRAVQPVTGGGRLYVGHSDGVLRAISEANGQLVWSVSLGGEILNTAAYDPSSASVYVGSTNGRLYRVNSANGQKINEFNVGGEIYMAPLLAGNAVYIGSSTGIFYALDKITLQPIWQYNAGASLIGSPAYSASHGGLIILLAEDPSVHAVRASNGTRLWRTGAPVIGGDRDQYGMNMIFLDTFPVVADLSGVVIVRSYRTQFPGTNMGGPGNTAPRTVEEIRTYLTQNPEKQSMFVLDLATGAKRYVSPVGAGGIGDGIWTVGPQAVVKPLGGVEVAYLLWRTRQACEALGSSGCDSRDDTTLGEMDLQTGNIRFVQDHRNAGTLRVHTDEQSPLSMAGNMIFHAHWMTLGSLRILDRSATYGSTYTNPIRTEELTPATNTIAAGSCPNRSNHFCPQLNNSPCDGYGNDPAFYVYYSSTCVYDAWWHVGPSGSPVRAATISNNTIYWKTVDGAIMALTSR